MLYNNDMSQTGAERQATYRARRKDAGLCTWAGCPELVDSGHVHCAAHLEAQRRTARERTALAAKARASDGR